MLRRDPLAYLPALLAITLTALAVPARAEALLISLCSGGSLPDQPVRDCDPACRVGCNREKKASGQL
ncbi:hypothetical protein [Sandarakinorhabdus sp.]|uniref:hypothetical protein n=1 Tax=Sandarakinorhabdus sp. TaxID=1916663 RepID=UPI00286E92AA|nr:hypothetical protein [Sandarakinorhabdus sp.]